MSPLGPSRHLATPQHFDSFQRKAGIACTVRAIQNANGRDKPGHSIASAPPPDYVCVFFFPNNAFTLSNNSILAPCLRMMIDCCVTDSVLFQAQ